MSSSLGQNNLIQTPINKYKLKRKLNVNKRFGTGEFRFFYETSNGRLPLEHGSHTRQTFRKRVSNDSQRFIFRHWKFFFDEKFGLKFWFFAIFARFRRSWRQTDLKINFHVKFCSGYTRPEVCAIQNREKKGRTWPPPALSQRLVPDLGLGRGVWSIGDGGCVAWIPTHIKW